jgi:hypothetical protein
MAEESDRISQRHGGKVPLQYWQKAFLIDIVPDPAAPYVSKIGNTIYLDTKHPEYTRWLVGFVRGAAKAVNDAIKKQSH